MELKKIIRPCNGYLLLLIWFLTASFTDINFFGMEAKNFMEKYFGMSKYLIFGILIVNYFISYVKIEKKKTMMVFINYFSYVGLVSWVILFMNYKLNLFSKNPIDKLEHSFIKMTVFDYNLGLIPSYLSSLVTLSKNPKIFYIGTGIAVLNIILIVIIFINWIFVNNYKNIKSEYKKRKAFEKKEEEVKEKIAIKEAVEKNAVNQIERIKQEKERQIQEKVMNLNLGRTSDEIDEIRSKVLQGMSERENEKK